MSEMFSVQPEALRTAAAGARAVSDDLNPPNEAMRNATRAAQLGMPGFASAVNLANRTVLKQEIADLQHKFDLTKGTAARSEWPVELRSAQDWHRERDRLDAMLLLRSKIDYRMTAEEDPYGQAVPPTYLLGYDNSGAGKAIVAVGNPDTAGNVVVNVPGQGANPAGVDDYIDRAAAGVQIPALRS